MIRLVNTGCGCPPCGGTCLCLAGVLTDRSLPDPVVACGGTWTRYGFAQELSDITEANGWTPGAISDCDQDDIDCCRNMHPLATPPAHFKTWSRGSLDLTLTTDLMAGLTPVYDEIACAIADLFFVPSFLSGTCPISFVTPHEIHPIIPGASVSWTGSAVYLHFSGVSLVYFYRDYFEYPDPLYNAAVCLASVLFAIPGASPEQYLHVMAEGNLEQSEDSYVAFSAVRVVRSA